MMRYLRIAWVLVATWSRAVGAQVPVSRDSAGVAIVENPAPDHSHRAFRLADTPDCELSLRTGKLEPVALDAARLPDGRIVVGDVRTGALLFYGCDGRLLSTAGGRDDRPERRFRDNIERVFSWRADSLVVGLQGRTIVTDLNGSASRGLGPKGVLCALGDGSVLVERFLRSTASGSRDRGGSTYRRDFNAYLRYATPTAEAPSDTVMFLAGSESASLLTGAATVRSDGHARANSVFLSRPPLGYVRSVRCDRDRLVTGDGSSSEYQVYSPTGALLRIIRTAPRKMPSARAVRDAQIEYMLEPLRGPDALSFGKLLDDLDVPRRVPSYVNLQVDALSRVWLEDAPADASAERWWEVYDPAGALLGSVSLPRGARVLSIDGTHIVLASRDRDAKSQVLVYRLIAN